MAVMKWPPSEFWAATPYDCLLAAGGMAKIYAANDKNKLTAKQATELASMARAAQLREKAERAALNNGNS